MSSKLADLEATLEASRRDLLDQIDRELSELREHRDALNVRISGLARKRLRYLDTAGASHQLASGTPPKPTALTQFLREHQGQHFKLVEVRRALIARGWMRDDPRERHALEVAALALAQRGEIRRVRRGVYAYSVGNSAPLEASAAA